jgi:hypothetical protein
VHRASRFFRCWSPAFIAVKSATPEQPLESLIKKASVLLDDTYKTARMPPVVSVIVAYEMQVASPRARITPAPWNRAPCCRLSWWMGAGNDSNARM